MTLTIDLPPELEKMLQQCTARSGQNVSAFVLQAVQEKITKSRTFAEICAPFALAVEASQVSDEEFDHFFEEMRNEVWQEKQSPRE